MVIHGEIQVPADREAVVALPGPVDIENRPTLEVLVTQHFEGMCCKFENMREQKPGWCRSHGCGDPEETFHEVDLINDRSLRQPSQLTFPNHVYRFDSLDRHHAAAKDRKPRLARSCPSPARKIVRRRLFRSASLNAATIRSGAFLFAISTSRWYGDTDAPPPRLPT
jgi:hypothetical protein